MIFDLKKGDKVVLNNSDTNVYEIKSYCNIGNGYICKGGKGISRQLILRYATPNEIQSGFRIDGNNP